MDKKEDKKGIANWIKEYLLFLFLSIGIGLIFLNIDSVLSANILPTASVVASKNIPTSDPHMPNVEASIPAASSASGEVAQNAPTYNPNASKDNDINTTPKTYLNRCGLAGIYIILMVIIYSFMYRKPTKFPPQGGNDNTKSQDTEPPDPKSPPSKRDDTTPPSAYSANMPQKKKN